MAEMHKGYSFRPNQEFHGKKIDFASYGFVSYFSDTFLFQSGHVYDVISPKLGKVMIENLDS